MLFYYFFIKIDFNSLKIILRKWRKFKTDSEGFSNKSAVVIDFSKKSNHKSTIMPIYKNKKNKTKQNRK